MFFKSASQHTNPNQNKQLFMVTRRKTITNTPKMVLLKTQFSIIVQQKTPCLETFARD